MLILFGCSGGGSSSALRSQSTNPLRHSLNTTPLTPGTVWAWGSNSNGQLGNNSTADSYIPVQVTTMSGVIAIASGGAHTIALKSDGTVWTWGNNNYGQLGNNSQINSYVPIQVSTLSQVTAIGCGINHTIAVRSDGTVWTWGWNSNGQLGNNSTTDSPVPVQAIDLIGVKSVVGGYFHTMALVGNAIFGQVTLDGTGFPGVTVTLSGAGSSSTTTDINGNYSLTAADGLYTITPFQADYTFNPANISVTVSGVNVTGQDFTATAVPRYSISGQVTLNGSGLSGVTVTMTGTGSSSTTTDVNGNYSFAGAVSGSYTITSSMGVYTFNPANIPVTVTDAPVTNQNFAVITYAVSGQVTLNGSGLSGVTVNLTPTGTSSPVLQSATTDVNGIYTITGVGNGTYRVTPTGAGYTYTPSFTDPVTVTDASVSGVDFTGQ